VWRPVPAALDACLTGTPRAAGVGYLQIPPAVLTYTYDGKVYEQPQRRPRIKPATRRARVDQLTF
jgi:hypothetical protein